MDDANNMEEEEKASELRTRRRTAKVVNYAREQTFSDASDVFEDSDAEVPMVQKRRARARKSNAASAANDDIVGDDDDDGYKRLKPVYSERGYDPALPPIRDRFPFLPEYEPDGSPRIDLIVGRRPVDEKEDNEGNMDGPHEDEKKDEASDDGADGGGRRPKRAKKQKGKSSKQTSSTGESPVKREGSGPVEYEYLIKYKGRSYLHLEWKTGADLESMNKSAKGIYRRYLKKVGAGDEELEDPNFDPSFAVPQKIVDEADQELTVELTDKELLEWEKEREKEIAEEEDDDDDGDNQNRTEGTAKQDGDKADDNDNNQETDRGAAAGTIKEIDGELPTVNGEQPKEKEEENFDDWEDTEIDFSTLSVDRLRKIVNSDGSYYPTFEGSNNAYRDGYITEPPKKPRASYLFFQCSMRGYFKKRNPNASQAELMTILGETWGAMTEAEQAPFIQLAKEESAQHDKERALMEKAQKPNEVWQPIRRCAMVLDKIVADGFANIFLEPVDAEDFPDYSEVIDHPMDLGTVGKNLKNRKYLVPEQFARDMRKVWNNCKIYNQHGSAIWHVADYMSKLFERLYHAWVMEFRERYLRWVHPKARPWEPTCRQCDGKCKTPDDQLVACDHCDALFGFKCLPKPLKKLPKGVWHCEDCKPKLKSSKGIRMLSAVAENAARKRAELGDTPKKKINQTMYLVKWAGLGYEYCTWETRKDINDDRLIAEFKKLNSAHPDEPDMPEAEVDQFLKTAKHLNSENAGGSLSLPDMRSQLYAQSRALQFSKFGLEPPHRLCSACGPKTTAAGVCGRFPSIVSEEDSEHERPNHVNEVVECVSSLVDHVARQDAKARILKMNEKLPPLMTGEYDAIIPITSKGLMMNVGEIHGSVAFLGYRAFEDGSKGPAELANIIRNQGDKIVAVDGVSTVKRSFKEVIGMLRESGKHKFCHMRFLENSFSVCDGDLASSGKAGRYTLQELQKKFAADRQKLLIQRKLLLNEVQEEKVEEEESDASAAPDDSDADSEDGSEGEFQPDSDEDELMKEKRKSAAAGSGNAAALLPDAGLLNESGEAASGQVASSTPIGGEVQVNTAPPIVLRQETTRSLAYRLLDFDIGNSSDEGGDEDCAFFVDGVDQTFTTLLEVEELVSNQDDSQEKKKADPKAKQEEPTVPVRRNEFVELGDRAKLAASVVLAKKPPVKDDFDNFPFPSSKELQALAQNEAAQNEGRAGESPPKTMKKSTVKIEQVSTTTNDVIHVWASAESAAATLQLPLNEIKQLISGDYDEDLGDEVGGFRWRFAPAGAKVTAGIDSNPSARGKKAREAWLEFRDKLYDPSEPHMYKNGNRLRDYQVDGVNWLASTFYKKHGCILADEMGLGKTVQIVCYIEHLYRVENIHKPYLVVVPLSTVEHWRREFEGWTDMVCCIYHDRQRVWRDVLREYEWYYEDRPHTPEFLKFDVLVTTYDTLIGDFDIISQIPFRVAVVDEAHRLRNQKGKLLECMREISARGTLQWGFQSRVLMSGTPLQNDLDELWTLLNFIEPARFVDLEQFQFQYGNISNREQVEALQEQISPFMLRRVKEDVAKDIPAKEETVIDVELTAVQKQYYRAIFEHNHAFLNIGGTRTNAPKLMNIQMELRKVCNHPFLLEGIEHRETDRLFKEFLEKGEFEGKTPEEQHHMLAEHGYIMTSGKMVLLDKLLPKLRQEGHKILIFSQMVRMLDVISEYCELRHFPYERLDGRVRGTDRQKSIDRFEREKDSFLFLLSTRAGGVGINLTAADICIIFDSDWNPQNDIQAQARCHRIGQTKDVRIYRLITSRSFEQEMFERASKKLGLEQAILGTFGQDNDDDKPTSAEMEMMLKKGAYHLLAEDNDEEGEAFCSDDIENILAKRTRTRVVEGAKTASWLNKQGMVVSKSKFTSEAGGPDLDMEDPLFWQKIMPDLITCSTMQTRLDELLELVGEKKGPGRGRGRWKKKQVEAATDGEKKGQDEQGQGVGESEENRVKKDPEETEADDKHDEEEPEEDGDKQEGQEEDAVNGAEKGNNSDDKENNGDDDEEAEKKEKKKQLSRAALKKINKFMSDLKSMMEDIFEQVEDDTLAPTDKTSFQKLLLTVSLNEKLFNEQQRHVAKVMLKRLEGDRRRRCRTSDQPPQRSPAKRFREEGGGAVIPEELRIVGKKKKKRRKRSEMGDEPERKRRKRAPDEDDKRGYLGEDGYLHHSDSEADWSDVGEGLYEDKKRLTISSREARRRRQWAADDDAATAAGRPWPVFPRSVVAKVLGTVLDDVMKYDKAKGGLFSVPVPKDDFPEYYEQIKNPMDYGTMQQKLKRGEYRSAQAMQKDFVLVMQNCLQFNSANSDIVKEARQQALMRPGVLRKAVAKHNLFLAEDGSVLDIVDESSEKKGDEKAKKKMKGKKSIGGKENGAEEEDDLLLAKKKIKKFKKEKNGGAGDTEEEDDDDKKAKSSVMKPRIRIRVSLGSSAKQEDDEDSDDAPLVTKLKKKRKRSKNPDGEGDAPIDDDATPIPKRRRRKVGDSISASEKKPRKASGKVDAGDEESTTAAAEAEVMDEMDEDQPIVKSAESKEVSDDNAGEPGEEPKEKSIFLDLDYWKNEREKHDGSFKSARELLTRHGPWKLPSVSSERKFRLIAKSTLVKMDRHDRYSVFAEAVTDNEAPGYSDVIKKPMDFGTMRDKVEGKEYGTGDKALKKLYQDFLLVFDNCFAYNDAEGEVAEEAARLLTLLPEAFVSAAVAVSNRK